MDRKEKLLPLTNGEVLCLRVSYSKGGMNFFSGSSEKRGYWLHCGPEKRKDGCRGFVMFSGMKAFLLEVKRQSPKALAEAEAMAAAKERELILAVLDKQGLALANPQDLPAAPQQPAPAVSGVVKQDPDAQSASTILEGGLHGGPSGLDAAPRPRTNPMLMLTKENLAALPPLGSQENNPDPTAQVKFFDPCGSWTWYATEYDPVDRQFFGLVKGLETELGYFSLDELEAFRGPMQMGIERDRHFRPCPLSQVW